MNLKDIIVSLAVGAILGAMLQGRCSRKSDTVPVATLTDPGIQSASNTVNETMGWETGATVTAYLATLDRISVSLSNYADGLDDINERLARLAQAHRTNRTMPGVRTNEPSRKRFPLEEEQ